MKKNWLRVFFPPLANDNVEEKLKRKNCVRRGLGRPENHFLSLILFHSLLGSFVRSFNIVVGQFFRPVVAFDVASAVGMS